MHWNFCFPVTRFGTLRDNTMISKLLVNDFMEHRLWWIKFLIYITKSVLFIIWNQRLNARNLALMDVNAQHTFLFWGFIRLSVHRLQQTVTCFLIITFFSIHANKFTANFWWIFVPWRVNVLLHLAILYSSSVFSVSVIVTVTSHVQALNIKAVFGYSKKYCKLAVLLSLQFTQCFNSTQFKTICTFMYNRVIWTPSFRVWNLRSRGWWALK